MKTNIISFSGYSGCGKSTYINKLKLILEKAGYTVAVANSNHSQSMQEWEDKVCSEHEQDPPRFLLVHHIGRNPLLEGMGIGFHLPDGAMDLWAAMHGFADPHIVGKEAA